jgi:hypothetical protein
MTDDTPLSGTNVTRVVRTSLGAFQIRLFQSCVRAISRLEVATRTSSDTFTETGEVLFWLYAISNYGSRKAKLSRGLLWARNRYAHGQLFSEPHKMSGDHYDTDFVWDRSTYAEPHWKHVFEIHFDEANATADPKGVQAYQDELAGQPVLATLHAEATRLLKLARSKH